MNYRFLHEASSKMMLHHICEVEYCAREIINNFYKKNSTGGKIYINKCCLNTFESEASNNNEFVFNVLLTDSNKNYFNKIVTIPIIAFDTVNEHYNDIKIE